MWFWLVLLSQLGLARKVCNSSDTKRTITFVNEPGRRLQMDLYMPAITNKKKVPVLVFLFSGGMMIGKRELIPCRMGCQGLNVKTLTAAGIAVASIDYRRCIKESRNVKKALYPGPLYDAKRAVRYLRMNGDELGLDGTVGCFGLSAGGGLCAALAITSGSVVEPGVVNDGQDRVDLAVPFAAWVDFEVSEESPIYVLGWNKEPVCTTAGLSFYDDWARKNNSRLASLPAERLAAIRNMSLIKAAEGREKHELSPVFFIHGRIDNTHPVEGPIKLHNVLQRKGVESKLFISENLSHLGEQTCFGNKTFRDTFVAAVTHKMLRSTI